MRMNLPTCAIVLVSCFAVACSDDGTGGAGGSSSSTTTSSSTMTTTSSTGAGTPSLTVSPNPADLLTCTTTKFTATVTGETDTSVDWSVSPTPAGGAIASDGTYTAPIKKPAPSSASVTATSHADATLSATAPVTLATVHPSPDTKLPGSEGTGTDVYAHLAQVSGSTGYAAWRNVDGTAIQFAKSTDGGKTWAAPKNIDDSGPGADASCSAVAIDPADPQTAYVVYRLNREACGGTQNVGVQGDSTGTTLVLAVTKDGGATFVHHQLSATFNGYAICPDVVAPSAGHVIVSAPTGDPTYIDMFTSSSKGDDLELTGCDDLNDWYAPKTEQFSQFVFIAQDGGSSSVTESPRMFTDGNHDACVTFTAGESEPWHAYVSCTKDDGGSWSEPKQLDADTNDPRLPQGTFGPNGEVAIGWWSDDDSSVHLVTAPGIGTTFSQEQSLPQYSAPTGPLGSEQFGLVYEGATLFVAAHADDGLGTNRIVVDKSCDGAQTWSGVELVNGQEGGTIHELAFPELFSIGGAMNLIALNPEEADGAIYQLSLEP